VAPGVGLLRLVRAAFFAVSAVGLASAAHLAAGDDVPLWTALASVPAVMLVVNLLAAGRRGPIGLFVGMGLTQFVLHVVFMMTAIAPSCGSPAAMSGAAMSGHGHFPVVCEPVAGHGVGLSGFWPSPGMLLAHTLATVLLVLLLAHGEAALWALTDFLTFRFPTSAAVALSPLARPVPVTPTSRRRIPQSAHLRTVRRRGPPLVTSAVH
jgi:hypothetical protein